MQLVSLRDNKSISKNTALVLIHIAALLLLAIGLWDMLIVLQNLEFELMRLRGIAAAPPAPAPVYTATVTLTPEAPKPAPDTSPQGTEHL